MEYSLALNGLVLIAAARADEQGTSTRIAEDVAALAMKHGFFFRQVTVRSCEEFESAIDAVEEQVKNGLRPALHFDQHGEEKRGLEIGITFQFYSWTRFVQRMRAINVATENNLLVVLHACYAFRCIREVSILEPTPWHTLIAPPGEVSIGFLEDAIPKFVERLHAKLSLSEAFEVLAPKFALFNCNSVLIKALASYVNQYGRGRASRSRAEILLTTAAAAMEPGAPLRDLRAKIKSGIKLSQSDIDKFASRFLHSCCHGVSLDEVIRWASERRA